MLFSDFFFFKLISSIWLAWGLFHHPRFSVVLTGARIGNSCSLNISFKLWLLAVLCLNQPVHVCCVDL